MLIILIAAFFRFWQIGHLPDGLFPDEAANGLDVNSILQGDLQPFYERGNGREALFFYFLALSVSLFGRGPIQHHIVSAGFGLASVVITYFLTKEMFGKRTALLATFFVAISSFAVTVSRTAFRANTLPFFAAFTIFAIIKFFKATKSQAKYKWAILSGISFALGFYTYISYRMMIPLLLIFFVFMLIGFRNQIKPKFWQLIKYKSVFGTAVIVTLLPLFHYFFTHPGSFSGRAGQVSIFSPDLNKGDLIGTAWAVFEKTMFGFFTVGDLNWRHNVSGFPFLSPLLSPFFALGLIIFTWAVFKLIWQIFTKTTNEQIWYQALIAVMFWFMLVPELVTAEGIPHGLRLIGIIPAIFIMPAWVLDKIWERIIQIIQDSRFRYALAGIFLVTLFVYNFQLYFTVAANSPEYYYAFRSDLTDVSEFLNTRNDKNTTYLSLDKFSVQTVEYLTTPTNQPYTLVDPAHTFEVRLNKGDVVVFTQSTIYDSAKFLETHPDAKLIKQLINQFGQTIMSVYQQP